MAGARVELEFDGRVALNALRQAAELLGNPSELLNDIGEAVTNRTRDRFRLERAPDGAPWAALNPRYLARKRPNPGKILHRHGHLSRQLFHQVESASVLVGTDRIYGAVHQFGWAEKNIPARPFLGIDADDEDEIQQIIRDHLARRLTGGGA